MDRKLIPVLGLTRVECMAEEDQNAELMYRGTRSGPTPFFLDDLLDAVEDVARGLRPEIAVRFLLARHVVVVGGDEWHLDGDLALWRKAKAYAGELNHQGLLEAVGRQGELVFEKNRKEDRMTEIAIVRGIDGVTRVLVDRDRRCKVYRPTRASLRRLNVLTHRHRDKVEPFFTRDYVGFKLVVGK